MNLNINALNYSHEVDVSMAFLPCIYALVDPNSDSVKYIGQTNYVESRYYQHLTESRKAENSLYEWISDLISRGQFPKLVVLETCKEDNLSMRERHWIKLVNDGGGELFNFGGKRCFFYTYDALSTVAKRFGGALLSECDSGYVSGDTILKWLCFHHGTFSKRANAIVSGHWCNECTQIEIESTGCLSKDIRSKRIKLIENVRAMMLT